MRKLRRIALSDATLEFLQRNRTDKVAKKRTFPKRTAEAKRLWRYKNNKAFREIRTNLKKMCTGLERCMYCEGGQATDIEHFFPKSGYPQYAYTWENYLLACGVCNSDYKGDAFPLDESGSPLLIDPTKDDPREHIRLTPKTGKFIDLSRKGEESIRVYGLNRPNLEKGRRSTWISVEALIVQYSNARAIGDDAYAGKIKDVLCHFDFSGVFKWLLDISDTFDAQLIIRPDCLAAINLHPGMKRWIS